MAYYLVVGGETWRQVATVGGLAQFREELERLDDLPKLKHLIEFGWVQGLDELEQQIESAVVSLTKDSADVAGEMLTVVKSRTLEMASAMLTNGLTETDDPDDSGYEQSLENKGDESGEDERET